jgi:hypothetical protein
VARPVLEKAVLILSEGSPTREAQLVPAPPPFHSSEYEVIGSPPDVNPLLIAGISTAIVVLVDEGKFLIGIAVRACGLATIKAIEVLTSEYSPGPRELEALTLAIT